MLPDFTDGRKDAYRPVRRGSLAGFGKRTTLAIFHTAGIRLDLFMLLNSSRRYPGRCSAMILTISPGTPSTPTAILWSHFAMTVRRSSSVTSRSCFSSHCVRGMRELWSSSHCSARLVSKRSSRILAILFLLRPSVGTFRSISALTTRYGLPQGSCSRVAQKSLHFSSLRRSIALYNLLLASLNSFTTRPALSLLSATICCALLLDLRVTLLNSDNSSFHQ